MRNEILKALKASSEGNIEKARLNIEIYLKTPVGIGEHPDVLAAIIDQVDLISKEEELIIKATQLTKVRTDVGLAKRPVGVAVDMYVNPETGTYTIIEFHPTYKSYCVISYGTKFQVFLGGVQ